MNFLTSLIHFWNFKLEPVIYDYKYTQASLVIVTFNWPFDIWHVSKFSMHLPSVWHYVLVYISYKILYEYKTKVDKERKARSIVASTNEY